MPEHGPDSLGPLEDLVGAELQFQQQHFESLDAKAGIVLGFAAAVVALSAGVTTATAVAETLYAVATMAAGLASLVSIAAFWPRKFEVLDVQRARDDALGRLPDALTRVAVLDTRVRIIDANRRLLFQKARRLKLAATSLVVAVVLIGAGSMVERLEGERMSDEHEHSDTPQPSEEGQSSGSEPMPSHARPEWITYVEKGTDPKGDKRSG